MGPRPWEGRSCSTVVVSNVISLRRHLVSPLVLFPRPLHKAQRPLVQNPAPTRRGVPAHRSRLTMLPSSTADLVVGVQGLLIRLPCDRFRWSALRAEEDPLSLWTRVRPPCSEGGRSIQPLQPQKHHQVHCNPNSRLILVLTCEEHATIQDRDGTKIVYILLPYFRRGNLQDAINANLVNHTSFPELELLKLFRGVCVALEQLHEHKVTAVSSTRRGAPRMEEEPLMDEDTVADEDEELGQLVPFAHRDIKPGITPPPPPIPHPLPYCSPFVLGCLLVL